LLFVNLPGTSNTQSQRKQGHYVSQDTFMGACMPKLAFKSLIEPFCVELLLIKLAQVFSVLSLSFAIRPF
jgi:hypothetical protein